MAAERKRRQEAGQVPGRKPETATNEAAARLFLVGFVCLCVGLAIGYLVGNRNAGPAGPPAPVAVNARSGPAGPTGQPSPASPAAAQAEASLRALLMSNPKDLEALIQLGNLHYDQGRHDEAIDWYGRALEINPKNPNVRTDRGTSYWYTNRPDQAIAEYEKSLAVDPGHEQTLYNMGLVQLRGKNNLAEAKRFWQKLLQLRPDHPAREEIERQLSGTSAPIPPLNPVIPKK